FVVLNTHLVPERLHIFIDVVQTTIQHEHIGFESAIFHFRVQICEYHARVTAICAVRYTVITRTTIILLPAKLHCTLKIPLEVWAVLDRYTVAYQKQFRCIGHPCHEAKRKEYPKTDSY